MGRKIQITKEQMLKAGLQIILRDGYEVVAIKTVAKELHCSTQPISWSFGNIENYWIELRQYALAYLKKKLLGNGQNAINYRKTAQMYIEISIDEPNLIRYLRSDKEALCSMGGIGIVFDESKNVGLKAQWAKELNMTEEDALSFIKFFVTYTDGVVSLLLSGAMSVDKEMVKNMLDDAESAYKAYLLTKKG